MSTIEKKFVGEVAAEQIVANVKDALNEKQPKGNYALSSDIPTTLPNPKSLVIYNGNNSITYNGASQKVISIPTPYEYATANGYTGTEELFVENLGKTHETPDWSANVGSSGHILNRTHWKSGGVLLPETVAPYNEDMGCHLISPGIIFENGAEYDIVLDGVSYTVTGRIIDLYDAPIYYVGNSAIVGGENTGESFFIATSTENSQTYTLVILDTPAESITLSISTEESIQTLPKEYLPEDGKLPNPNTLTFTGAVEGTYDGSTAVSINIPTTENKSITFTGAVEGTYDGSEDLTINIPVPDEPKTLTFTGAVKGTYDGSEAFTVDIPYLVNGQWTSSLRSVTAAEETDDYSLGVNAMAIGVDTKAQGYSAFAQGAATQAIGENSHAEGHWTVASGRSAHAEGESTVANGIDSHAEGSSSKATARGSHAEGHLTEANGEFSHSEGFHTIANGNYSHTEGTETVANAENAHAEGYRTYANSSEQHVQGRYNIPDNDGKYAHIVGNGYMSESYSRITSNAHTIDWDGVGWFAGGLKVGGASQDDPNAVNLFVTQEDAIALMMDMNLVEPVVAEDGSVYVDENGAMYTII